MKNVFKYAVEVMISWYQLTGYFKTGAFPEGDNAKTKRFPSVFQ